MKTKRVSWDDIIEIKRGTHRGQTHCSVTFDSRALSLTELAGILGRQILPGPVNYIANDQQVVVAYTGFDNETWLFSDGLSLRQ